MSPLIRKYYDDWMSATTLIADQSDTEKFYAFIKSVIKYSRKYRNGHWLRYFLEKDLPQKYNDKAYCDQKIQQFVALFDHFIDFHKIKFPKHLIEMRDPIKVKWELQSIEKENGQEFYNDSQIDQIIKKNFGENWRDKYYKRIA